MRMAASCLGPSARRAYHRRNGNLNGLEITAGFWKDGRGSGRRPKRRLVDEMNSGERTRDAGGKEKMTLHEWIASLIGILQCALIAYGLRTMRVAGEHRNREGERRRAETMAALEELISRTGRAPANQVAG